MKRSTERDFTRQVLLLAKLRRWRVIHVRPARTLKGWVTPVEGNGVGWPDLFMVRGKCLVAAELKVGKRKPTAEQEAWLTALEAAGVAVFRWTPANWAQIERVLEHGVAP